MLPSRGAWVVVLAINVAPSHMLRPVIVWYQREYHHGSSIKKFLAPEALNTDPNGMPLSFIRRLLSRFKFYPYLITATTICKIKAPGSLPASILTLTLYWCPGWDSNPQGLATTGF